MNEIWMYEYWGVIYIYKIIDLSSKYKEAYTIDILYCSDDECGDVNTMLINAHVRNAIKINRKTAEVLYNININDSIK